MVIFTRLQGVLLIYLVYKKIFGEKFLIIFFVVAIFYVFLIDFWPHKLSKMVMREELRNAQLICYLEKYKKHSIHVSSLVTLYFVGERSMNKHYPYDLEGYKEMCIKFCALHMFTYRERMNIIERLNSKEYLFLEVKNRPSYVFYKDIEDSISDYGNFYVRLLLIGLAIRENNKMFNGEETK
jgi:hypothetical protein